MTRQVEESTRGSGVQADSPSLCFWDWAVGESAQGLGRPAFSSAPGIAGWKQHAGLSVGEGDGEERAGQATFGLA